MLDNPTQLRKQAPAKVKKKENEREKRLAIVGQLGKKKRPKQGKDEIHPSCEDSRNFQRRGVTQKREKKERGRPQDGKKITMLAGKEAHDWVYSVGV